MASGWAPDGAVQDQIDDTVTDGVMSARARVRACRRARARPIAWNAVTKSPKRAAMLCPELGRALRVSRRLIAAR